MKDSKYRSLCALLTTSCRVLIVVTVLAGVYGCANMNTISRSTNLPGERKALHLDIHQRAIIASADKYCAEPSPDGLAAYAAAIGLSVGKPASSADSLTTSGSSSVAGVGLRTQSITLMRDLMYRICEASANKSIGDANVAVLLGQSQDLATVILAIEQLTGPVAASQAALIAGSQSASTATIAVNSKQLELLTEALERANNNLEETKAEKAAKEMDIEAVEAEKKRKTTALAQAEEEDNQETRDILSEEIVSLTSKLNDLKKELAVYEEREAFRQGIVDDARAAREKVLESQEAALSSGSTTTSGSNAFDTQSPANKIAAEASVKVTEAVQEIVKHALNKPYLNEACISVITTPLEEVQTTGMSPEQIKASEQRRRARLQLQNSCVELINSSIEKQRAAAAEDAAKSRFEKEKLETQTNILQTKSSIDKVMNCITNNGTVSEKRLARILALPKIKSDLSNSLTERNAEQLRAFLAINADQLEELAQRIDSATEICL